MKTNLRRRAILGHCRDLALFGLAAVFPLTAACASRERDRATEEAAVRAAWQEVSEAFMAADWDRYAALWVQSDDLQVVHPGQRDWLKGWEAFAGRYQDLVSEGAEWSFSTTQLEVRVDPSGDTAWVIGELQIGFAGRTQPAWQMAVFRRHNGQWKIAAAFSSPVPAQ